MLRYLSFKTLCDLTFVCFMVSWFITRHVLFIIAIKSTYIDIPKLVPAVWDPANGYYMTKGVWMIFLSMLITLEVHTATLQRHETILMFACAAPL